MLAEWLGGDYTIRVLVSGSLFRHTTQMLRTKEAWVCSPAPTGVPKYWPGIPSPCKNKAASSSLPTGLLFPRATCQDINSRRFHPNDQGHHHGNSQGCCSWQLWSPGRCHCHSQSEPACYCRHASGLQSRSPGSWVGVGYREAAFGLQGQRFLRLTPALWPRKQLTTLKWPRTCAFVPCTMAVNAPMATWSCWIMCSW